MYTLVLYVLWGHVHCMDLYTRVCTFWRPMGDPCILWYFIPYYILWGHLSDTAWCLYICVYLLVTNWGPIYTLVYFI